MKTETVASRKKSQFDQAAYVRDYARENIQRVSVVLSKKHDQDVIDRLSREKSKSGYIKKLIRDDIRTSGQDDQSDPTA